MAKAGPKRAKQYKEDGASLTKIQEIHRKSKETYSRPRIHAELQEQGHSVGENRVARLMQIDGIRGRVADLYYAKAASRAKERYLKEQG